MDALRVPQNRKTSYASSLVSDAAGEPLMDDASSAIIPKSARPLIGSGGHPKNAEDSLDSTRTRSALRISKIEYHDYDPPSSPDSTSHRADSVQSKNE